MELILKVRRNITIPQGAGYCPKSKNFSKRLKLSWLIAFVVLILGFGINAANAQSLESKIIAVNFKSISLKDALRQIEAKTNFIFSYKTKDIETVQGIVLNAPKISVAEVLKDILKGTQFSYVQINNNVVIKRANQNLDEIFDNSTKVTENTINNQERNIRTISGQVVNFESKEAISGASIVCSDNNKIGTISDIDGNFSIPITPNTKFLEISNVGYSNVSYAVTQMNRITVLLKPRSSGLSEVVLTGYTNVDKRLTASSVSSIKGADLERADLGSVDQMLQGKVPGLDVNITSTTPGAAPKIRLRGTATLAGNREPIWVVDGVVIDAPVNLTAQAINSLDNVNILSSAIAGLNPNDIDRIDVLKDASATALYGVNGANGVIVITTKRGRFNQKMTVNYGVNTTVGMAPNYNNLSIMNSAQRIDVSKEITDRGLNYQVAQPHIGYEGAYQDYINRLTTFSQFQSQVNYYQTLNTDWMSVLFQNSFSQSHNLSFSAGGANSSFYASLGYANQNSTAINNTMDRYSAMFKFNSQIAKNLNLALKMNGSVDKTGTPYSIDNYSYAYNTSRAIPYSQNGQPYFYTLDNVQGVTGTNVAAGYNVMNEMNHSASTNNLRSMDVTADLEWKFLKNFRFKGTYNYITSVTDAVGWADENTYYIANKFRSKIALGATIPTIYNSSIVTPRGGEYAENYTTRNAYTVRNSIDYSKTFRQHFFSIALGSEFRNTEYNTTSTYRIGYMPDRGLVFYQPNINVYPTYYTQLSNSSAAYVPLTLTDKITRFESYYGILTYSFKNRYTLNANLRNDGSNRFGTDINNKFLPTFSSAFRWIASDEKWFDKVKNLNLLAFRLSYGFNGNIPETQSPQLITTQPSINNVTGDDYSTVNTYANPVLRWEKTNTINGGIEMSWFNNRLIANIDLYYKKGTDLMSNLTVAPSNGVSAIGLNGAAIENKGYDVSLNFIPIKTKDWQWNVGVLFGKNFTKILQSNYASVGNVQTSNIFSGYNAYLSGNMTHAGADPNTLYAYQFTGLNPTTGMPTFYNLNTTDYKIKPLIADYYDSIFRPMGSRIPKFDGSFNTNIRYKNWGFNVSFVVKLGYVQRLPNLYNGSSVMIPGVSQNFSSEFLNRWRNPGDEANTNIPVLTDVNTTTSTSSGFYVVSPYYISGNIWSVYNNSDIRVVDGSHVRLSSVSVNYNFIPKKKFAKVFTNANIRLQGNDLFVIANKAFKGRDPETLPSSLGRRPSSTLSVNIGF